MGAKFATLGLVALATVFTFQLLSHASGANQLAQTGFSGTANLFKTLQGR